MKTAVAWKAGSASDPGLERGINEDRVLVNDELGVFLVVDGLGGHAAGEMAAETAQRIIDEELQAASHPLEDSDLRNAITQANNRIFELARETESWRGMACVLTLAALQDESVTVAHVGDTRLYLAWNGNLRKITADHSPVGELEDAGSLTEQEAMRHPRRNEVFRDVGSRLHEPDDSNFIETKRLPLRPDAALLLCSDGLSDVLSSTQIRSIVERYDGDPNLTAHELVAAANQAGGQDNISVIFVAGPEFAGSESNALLEVRSRHAITRPTSTQARSHRIVGRVLWLLVGMVLGIAFWAVLDRLIPPKLPVEQKPAAPRVISVSSSNPLGIIQAVSAAVAGDTVEVPPGDYFGPIELKDRVTLESTVPGGAVIRSTHTASPYSGIGVVAHDVSTARVEGFRLASDSVHPLRTGVLIVNSSIELVDTDVSGATDHGILIEGASRPALIGNNIHDNAGPGLLIRGDSAPRLVGNTIADNGKLASPFRPGIQIEAPAQPLLQNNVIVRNGIATLGDALSGLDAAIRGQNIVDTSGTQAKDKRLSGRAVPAIR